MNGLINGFKHISHWFLDFQHRHWATYNSSNVHSLNLGQTLLNKLHFILSTPHMYVTQVAYRCLLEACLSLSHLERCLFFVDIKNSSSELIDSFLLLQTSIKCEFVYFTDSTQTRVSWRLRPVLESCKCYEKGFVNMSIVFRFCLISGCCIWLRKYYFSTGLCLQQCCVEHGTSCPVDNHFNSFAIMPIADVHCTSVHYLFSVMTAQYIMLVSLFCYQRFYTGTMLINFDHCRTCR